MKLSTGIFLVSSLVGAAVAVPLAPGPRDLPLVESNKLRRALHRKVLLEHAEKYQSFADSTPDRNRVAGSVGHNMTVDYLYETLAATGYYNVNKQPFTYIFSKGNASFSALSKTYDSNYFDYSPSTGGSTLIAPLAKVANLGCDQSDYPDLTGKIALISRGTCDFGLKVARAGTAGAVGAVIYNNAPGAIGGGTLREISRPEGPYVPVAGISGTDGAALITAMESGTVEGKLLVNSVTEVRYTNNVCAITKGGDQNNIIMSGGHSDSVAAGPGINDNGSGSLGNLEIALQLTKWSVKNAVRFCFWSAEEFGLLGSDYYIENLPETERAKIALYLNFDMIASPNFGYFLYDGDGSAFNITGPPGSDAIEHLFEEYFEEVGLPTRPTAFSGRSDYGPFLKVGIPSGGIFTGAEGIKTTEQAALWGGQAGVAYDINYHKASDDVNDLNLGAWIQNTKAAAHAIATYALSTEDIPKRNPSKRVKRDKNHTIPGACGSEPVHVA
ncbi:Zn-dependent exopeptidase [Choiromyces venosus 120613-1]|uniref:Peptide hydrolase n=1 Tax=Choiromyces venosus 120613-1 TaxID=1336337 RepID=A0A3N4JN98_9PEZI|nr:Zn-dependent exopeptidase [Choiromyces venosus 120613-1]